MTLSEIARDRVVSRQFIQRVLAPLIKEGKVKQVPNPKSKRSPKLELTADGHNEVIALLEREAPLVEMIGTSVTIAELSSLKTVLDRIDAALASAPLV